MRYRTVVFNRRQFKVGKVASEITGTERQSVTSARDREFSIHIRFRHLSVYFWCISCLNDISFRRKYFGVFFQRHEHPFRGNVSDIPPGTIRIHIVITVTTYRTDPGKRFFGMRHGRPNGFMRELPSVNNVSSRKPVPILDFSVRKPDRPQNELLPIIPGRLPIYSYGNDDLLIDISTQVKIKIRVTSRIGAVLTYFLRFRFGSI